MKTIMVIIDGAASEDYKHCKWINHIGSLGEVTKVNNTPLGMEANSLNCITNMLGVPKDEIPKGRAYLEALAIGQDVGENDLVLRCNNALIEDGILIGNTINNSVSVSLPSNIRLVDMGTYKNLLIIKGGKKYIDSLRTFPPHENLGKDIKHILPSSDNKELDKLLKALVCKYGLYPWGESYKENIKSFKEIHNIKGSVVCKTEIVKGIAKAMKMYCPDIEGATAEVDTDLKAKVKSALRLSKEYDFVLLHINGADESAHRKDKKEKLEFIKSIDEEVVKYLIDNIGNGTSLIVTSDHETSSDSGKHINSKVDCYTLNKKEA